MTIMNRFAAGCTQTPRQPQFAGKNGFLVLGQGDKVFYRDAKRDHAVKRSESGVFYARTDEGDTVDLTSRHDRKHLIPELHKTKAAAPEKKKTDWGAKIATVLTGATTAVAGKAAGEGYEKLKKELDPKTRHSHSRHAQYRPLPPGTEPPKGLVRPDNRAKRHKYGDETYGEQTFPGVHPDFPNLGLASVDSASGSSDDEGYKRTRKTTWDGNGDPTGHDETWAKKTTQDLSD